MLMWILVIATASFLAIWTAMDQTATRLERRPKRRKWPPVTVLSDDVGLLRVDGYGRDAALTAK
jgi:hypothetical protein